MVINCCVCMLITDLWWRWVSSICILSGLDLGYQRVGRYNTLVVMGRETQQDLSKNAAWDGTRSRLATLVAYKQVSSRQLVKTGEEFWYHFGLIAANEMIKTLMWRDLLWKFEREMAACPGKPEEEWLRSLRKSDRGACARVTEEPA